MSTPIDPNSLTPHGLGGWIHLIWSAPLTAILLGWKKSRDFIFQFLKDKDAVSREELEALRKDVKDEIHFIHQDLSDKVAANAAQARQDSRDDRKWMESQFAVQFQKIDAFTTQVLLNQNNKK